MKNLRESLLTAVVIYGVAFGIALFALPSDTGEFLIRSLVLIPTAYVHAAAIVMIFIGVRLEQPRPTYIK